MFDIDKVRADFPILSREVHGKPLVYLDNAATTQKPLCVLDAMREEYLNANANVHRGVHYLSQRATELHEQARDRIRAFLNARSTAEIVFTRGTTEGDEVIVSAVEHHSNIVPWQLQETRRGIRLQVIPMNDEGVLDMAAFEALFNERTRLVSVAHVSNVLGTVNPVRQMAAIAHAHGVPIVVDGAQSAPHFTVDVQDIDCDFFVLSGHKMYGPTGIGVLYGKEEWLERLPPYQGGGEMIEHVSWTKTTFEHPPLKFEAGTPDYIASHGLATAIDYMEQLGMENIQAHEQELTDYAISQLADIPDMHLYGTGQASAVLCPHDAVVSFNVGNIHHMDVGTLLDQLGIAVRTGHHCAQPLMDRLGILGTVRASFALYNTRADVDTLVAGIRRVQGMF